MAAVPVDAAAAGVAPAGATGGARFEIDCDNGWENDDASMKGCYTIVNVD